jgi:LPXTG-motif cell wall-anchored protein
MLGAVLGLAGLVGSASATPKDENGEHKLTICHRTNSDTNPYVINTPDVSGVEKGHGGHTGPVWNPTLKQQHIKWGDIIPPFDAMPNGYNWDGDGQAIWNNGCNVPGEQTTTTEEATTTTVEATTTTVGEDQTTTTTVGGGTTTTLGGSQTTTTVAGETTTTVLGQVDEQTTTTAVQGNVAEQTSTTGAVGAGELVRGSTLPRTGGSSTLPLSEIGLVLLLVGVAFIGAARASTVAIDD